MKVIKILFILFLCVLPFGEICRLKLVNNVVVHLNDIMLFLVLGAWIIFSKTKIKQIIKNQLFKPLVLFSGIALLSLFINMYIYTQLEILTSFLYLVRWEGYVMLYFVVRDFDEMFKNKIKYFLVVIGGITVVLGYVQYFLYPDLRNLYYAGWDEHLYRMFSTFLDPNFAGAFFVMYFLLVLHLFFQSVISHFMRDTETRFQVKPGMTNRVFYGFASLMTLGAIFLTYSRSAYLMFSVSGLVLLFMVVSSRRARTILVSLGLILFLVVLFFLSKLPQSSEGTNLFRTTSSFARVSAFQNAFTLFQENPIFGVGFNAYRYAQEKHGFIVPTEKENHAGAGTDNSFLFVLATTGLVGFGAYIYLLYKILRFAQNDNRVVLVASVAGLLVNALFINSLFYPFILEFLWIELALIDYKQQ